ncbi:MAG TPA: VOC family protein [Myxococcota bacterium]|nr:VOC family protein [Myxococcota bacterium]
MPQKITPFLWFDGQAQEAAAFYTKIFPKSRVLSESPMNVVFELEGQTFYGLNGGPQYKFTEAISMFVSCKDQKEVDYYWEALTAGGGAPGRCGWLKDKFGLSWQIIPEALPRLIGDSDRQKADRAVQAMLQMQKIDVAKLEAAHAGH